MTIVQMAGQLVVFEVLRLTKYTKMFPLGTSLQTSRCEDQRHQNFMAMTSKTSFFCGLSTLVSTMMIMIHL